MMFKRFGMLVRLEDSSHLQSNSMMNCLAERCLSVLDDIDIVFCRAQVIRAMFSLALLMLCRA